jgi:hypothetical protein
MPNVLRISADGAEYSDRLRELFAGFGVDPAEEGAIDEVSLIPAFVMGGASVTTEAHAHDDHVHVVGISVDVPDELEDAFYATLPDILVSDAEEDDEA